MRQGEIESLGARFIRVANEDVYRCALDVADSIALVVAEMKAELAGNVTVIFIHCSQLNIMTTQKIFLPAQWAIQGRFEKCVLSQMKRPNLLVDASVEPFENGCLCVWFDGANQEHRTIILPKKPSKISESGTEYLIAPDGKPISSEVDWAIQRAKIRWHLPQPLTANENNTQAVESVATKVLDSWDGLFSFAEEQVTSNGVKAGLRPAQIGALHAILARWTVDIAPATVVMPTGTGKTETMLSLMVCKRPSHLLIVVPSVPLREQLAAKFCSLGVLKGDNGWGGIIDASAHYPVVGKMEHGFQSVEAAKEFFLHSNVVVANIDAINACCSEVRSKISSWCDLLCVDETHHSAAVTWADVRRRFQVKDKPVLGFTATPYRNDKKLVEGDVIFSYPLVKVQKEGHFTKINFKPVRVFNPVQADELIALAAIEQLKEDDAKGYSHLIMARTNSIKRANDIYAIYDRLCPEFNPRVISNKTSKSEQREILRSLRSAQSRVIVCVNMFGEGFDLPKLKIAAMHDVHKSLAITLQFTGRFTRGRKDLGEATLIANTAANRDLKDALRALYSENPDWNVLLQDLSTHATERQKARVQILRNFDSVPSNLPIQNLNPKLSAETFKTGNDDWDPTAIEAILPEAQLLVPPIINYQSKLILFVTRVEKRVAWADVRDLRDINHHLNIIHFDDKRKLLFINSSDTNQVHQEWAEAICGKSVELIWGEDIFRALQGLNRLVLMNAGLKDTLSQAVRFMMLMGADVQEALKDGQLENRIKSNLFARGFRNGQRTSVGCSAKGRVWAHEQGEDISEWVEWCQGVGERLTDSTIDMQQVFKNALIPEYVEKRPDAVPIAFEWNEDTLKRGEESIYLEFKGRQIPFFDAELQVVSFSRQGNLVFKVQMEAGSVSDEEDEEDAKTEILEAEYEIIFDGKNFSYNALGEEIHICVGRRRTSTTFSSWLNREPLVVRFHDGSWLQGNIFCKLRKESKPFDPTKIEAWDWTGVDITKESQYKSISAGKRTDSIQHKLIEDFCSSSHDYDVVFNDDNAGEAADIIAIKALDDRLQVHLLHCKFAGKTKPGERIHELYEVCGQAQKSIHWRRDIEGLLRHMARRNEDWEKLHKVPRIQKGDRNKLDELILISREMRTDIEIAIVQPGISSTSVSHEQLELLSATEIYLNEVGGGVPFRVIGNK